MKVALINPVWRYGGSIYFGCRSPHLPLELGITHRLLQRHEQRWRKQMRDAGVWANDPVPLFRYPGSPDYRRLWGEPDDTAWERVHDHDLDQFRAFSDLQEQRPRRFCELEVAA